MTEERDNTGASMVLAVALIVVVAFMAVTVIVVFGPEDSTPLVVSVLGSAATVTTALLALLQARNANQKAVEAKTEVQKIHVSINSRMDQLLESAKGRAYSEGRMEERDVQQTKADAVQEATPIQPVAVTLVIPEGESVPVDVVDKKGGGT
jgi:hypothetical protein